MPVAELSGMQAVVRRCRCDDRRSSGLRRERCFVIRFQIEAVREASLETFDCVSPLGRRRLAGRVLIAEESDLVDDCPS